MPDDISATGLAWGIDSDSRVWIGGHCQGAKRIVVAAVIHEARPPDGQIDAGILSPLTVDRSSRLPESAHDILDTCEQSVVQPLCFPCE